MENNKITSTTPVPIGVKPKWLHDELVNKERFEDLCGAISRYYNAGLKINPEWIEEYNELLIKMRDNVKLNIEKSQKSEIYQLLGDLGVVQIPQNNS